MSKDQTAVQWLRETVKQMIYHGADFGDDQPALMEHLKAAEAKEFDQHGSTFARGYMSGFAGANGHQSVDFEQYYEDTYGTTEAKLKDHPSEHQDPGHQGQW